MTKLEELIKELCPNGVEYKTLGEFATVIRGGNFQKKDFVETGKPCIHYGQMYTHFKNTTDKTLTFVSDKVFNKSKQAQPNDIVMAVTSENVDDVCSCVAWLGKENIAVSGHTAIIHHNQNPSYMSYYFHSEHFYKQKVKLAHGTKVIEVTPDKLLNIQIPVPPLPVQEEVVRILNKFTSLTAELTAELTARRKQYEYYRDALLTRETKVVTAKLGDICEMRAGKAISAMEISQEKQDNYFPVYGGNGLRGYLNRFSHEGCYSIIGRQGALCGNVQYAEGQFYATEHAVVVKILKDLDSRYLFHLLTWMNLNQYKSAGAQPGLAVSTLEKLEIKYPKLETQVKIANVLDNFDAICTDLKIGLPAEIEARKKQYEYYRDLLLTFANSGNTILSEQNRTEQNRTEQKK